MSATDHEVEQHTEPAERPVLRRTYTAELTAGDGRTVDVRVVPYGVSAEVSDDGGRNFYREEWAAGCFDDQLVAGHRLKVLLNFEHQRGISNVVGKGVALRSLPDGLHATFRMSDTQDGDKALELIRDDILDSVSLEAYAKKSIRTGTGVLRRVKAHLHNVALCRTPAFADAKVLAVREDDEPELIIDEEILPVELNPELAERCRQLGINFRSDTRRTPQKRTPQLRLAPPKTAPALTRQTPSSEE
jgi:HK97 family phage prohead protease